MKHTKLKIDGCDDRDTMVAILAKNGYKVWITEKDLFPNGTDYFINFD